MQALQAQNNSLEMQAVQAQVRGTGSRRVGVASSLSVLIVH